MARRLLTFIAATAILVILPAVPAPAACTDVDPPNDCRENATPITSRFLNHLTASNVNAGVEAGEQLGPDMGNTVWWTFTAYRDSTGDASVHDSDHQAGVVVYELQSDGSLRFLDAASGWAGWTWALFECSAGRTYYIQAGGEEGQAGTIDLFGDACQLGAEVPDAPTLSAGYGPLRGDIALSYSTPDDGGAAISAREIQRSTTTCASWSTISPSDPSSTPIDAGLSEATVYCYRVRLQNTAGWSAWSNLAASAPRGVPTRPLGVVAAATGTSTIRLAWSPPTFNGGSAVERYAVSASDAATGTFTQIGEPTATSFTESGLAPGTTRYYRVFALNENGGGPGVAVSARTWAAPTAPRDVATSPTPILAVEVAWSQPADTGGRPITEYVVLRAEKGGALEELDRVPGSTRSYVDDPPLLVPFEYAVVAVNSVGPSPQSSRACGEAFPIPPPLEAC